jgi:hypothetical protein
MYVIHHHNDRNHQGLGHAILAPGDEVGDEEDHVPCRKRLGGRLKYYDREAA